jgi:hydroxymethylpyrimidine pyrophosphatase-like HAD family hydrolase
MAVIAIDLDGTLLRTDKKVSAHTREVLREVRGAGHTLVFATARNGHATWVALPEEFHDEWIAGFNGACVLRERRVVRQWLIPAADVAQVAAIVRGFGLSSAWGYVDGDGLVIEGSLAHHFGPEYYRAMDAGRSVFPASPKVLVDVPHGFPFAAFGHLLPTSCHFVLTDGGTLCQLMPAGVDKATGVAHVLAALGAAWGDTIAFGDDRNDLPLLKRVGRGIAMGNAAGAVKSAAHDIAASNDEDGVARWLEHWLRQSDGTPAPVPPCAGPAAVSIATR